MVNGLKRRLRDIEGYTPPNLWGEITKGGPRLPTPEPSPGRQPFVVGLALLIALGGVVVVALTFRGLSQDPAEPAAAVGNGLIAFVEEFPGDLYAGGTQSEILAMSPDGTMRIRLTDDPEAFDEDPAWSPDGTRVAFVKVGILTAPGIYVMNADGSDASRILEDATGPSSPSWSPDGTRSCSRAAWARRPRGTGIGTSSSSRSPRAG